MVEEGKELVEFEVPRISPDPLDLVQVGQFYHVRRKQWEDEEEDDENKAYTELMCVEEIGSNYIGFTAARGHGYSDVRIHFDVFEERCTFEPNWQEALHGEMKQIQGKIEKAMKKLLEQGQRLHLIPEKAVSTEEAKKEAKTLLPTTRTADPKKYKNQLVHFKKKYPEKVKKIEELAEDFAVTAKNLALPQIVQLGMVKEKLEKVEDRIFTIELYCGLKEKVKQIADGEPAPINELLTIRQLLLFMDEETLFEYESGGMDFSKLDKFDEWVAKPENLERILPEKKGVVAFRVRRHRKDYGTPSSLLEAWTNVQKSIANMETYLLIRNGERAYRIATSVDFQPRLIPLKDEIGEAQFLTELSYWEEREGAEPEKITPDDIRYDDHVKKLDDKLKHYNRMIILLQGLLDRSEIFHPHPGIKLTTNEGAAQWINLVRDEEDCLPMNKISWEEYLAEKNKGTKLGHWIYSNMAEKKKRGYWVNRRPRVCQVTKTRRDGSEVRVSWPWGTRHGYEHRDKWGNEWGKWGEWPVDKLCHEWIPADRFLNLNHYELNDYKMFLCDRALKGKYLEWAPYLLSAEDWKRDQIEKGLDVVEASRKRGHPKRIVKKKIEVEVEE